MNRAFYFDHRENNLFTFIEILCLFLQKTIDDAPLPDKLQTITAVCPVQFFQHAKPGAECQPAENLHLVEPGRLPEMAAEEPESEAAAPDPGGEKQTCQCKGRYAFIPRPVHRRSRQARRPGSF